MAIKKFINIPPSAHGFDWRAKKDKKKRVGNQTDGRTKGNNCVTNAINRYIAKHNRSYKHKDYMEWCLKNNIKNNYKG